MLFATEFLEKVI